MCDHYRQFIKRLSQQTSDLEVSSRSGNLRKERKELIMKTNERKTPQKRSDGDDKSGPDFATLAVKQTNAFAFAQDLDHIYMLL